MRDFLEHLASATDFMPHGEGLIWNRELLWLHVGSDLLTGLAYYLIAAVLFLLVGKWRDLPFYWLFLLFGAFILACGTTHLLAAWTIYVPSYWAEGVVKAVTAALSVATALLLVPFIFRLLTLPNLPALAENRALNLTLEKQVAELRAEIEKRQTSEAALQKSEERFRRMLEASHDAIILADEQSTILAISKGAVEIFGYEVGELVGRSLRLLMPKRYQEAHFRGVARYVATGKSQYLGRIHEFAGLRKDGSEFPLELNISSWIADGRFYFSGVIRDITARKHIEAERQTAYERFQILVDSLDALVYVADLQTYELLFVNKYGRDIWGDITGKTCWQVLRAGQDGPCLFCTNDKLLDAAGQPAGVYVWEFQNTVNDQWYECRDQAIEWTDGRYVRMEIATNITARKKAELETAKLEGQLRQAQKMEAIGTLAGGIAHDFNNILVPILAYAEMLMEKEPAGSRNRQDLQEIYKAATRARELVKQILTFSRERETEVRPVRVGPVIEESLKLLQASLPSTIEIRQHLAAADATILADPTQIHQVIMNLGTNALAAMQPQGGVLAVDLSTLRIGPEDMIATTLPPGHYLKLTVSDTGQGMDQATLVRIFDPYFTTKKAGEGTGLGLAVVSGIVKSYQGEIRVYSEPGQGASFHIYLPLFDQAAAGESAAAVGPLPGGHERILLVDDEAAVVHVMQHMLERLGYRIMAHTGSSEALAAFAAAPAAFDLVITDQTMPRLTGDQLALELIKIRSDIPIILSTGFSSMINEAQARALGIRAFLMKPVLRRDLAETIRTVLDEPPGRPGSASSDR